MPTVIYEDKNFLAVNKPAGFLVHEAKVSGIRRQVSGAKKEPRTRERTLVDWLLERYPEIKTVGDDPETRPGIVHRLDRETSGVMLVARTQEYFEYLKKLFQSHQIQKTYFAVVHGEISPRMGAIDAPIGLKSGTVRRSTRAGKMKMVKNAVTEYKAIKNFQFPITNRLLPITYSLLEIKPKTGRTHQIRVHLASIGHPIVGDKLYGGKSKKLPITRLMLHAFSLKFPVEEGRTIKIAAGPPPEFCGVPEVE